MKIFRALFVIFALFPSVTLAQDFEDGMRAYEAGNIGVALQSFAQSANQGDIRAQFMIGQFLANGTGIPKDVAQASKWYLLAAVSRTHSWRSCRWFGSVHKRQQSSDLHSSWLLG